MADFYKYTDRLFAPLYLISVLVRKDPSLWIFSEYSGKTYADNPKHLFEFIQANHSEVRAVWLTRKRGVLKKVRAKGYAAYHLYSPLGLYYAIKSGVAICCVDIACDFIGGIISPRTLYVNLWHGTPLKKIGKDIDRGGVRAKPWVDAIKKILSQAGLRHVHPIDFFASSSEAVSKTICSAFNLLPEKVKITGYPRNDVIFPNSSIPKIDGIDIIYMPTFRGTIGDEVDFFYAYQFDFKKMEHFLVNNNARLWIRLHRYNMPNVEILQKIEVSERIFMHKSHDIYEDLNLFDILITDVSSIYFDYLLLDRPIIFSAFDLQKYISQDRELYYEYEDVTPGPIAKNWDEVMKEMNKLFQEPSTYVQQRQDICQMFNEYRDSESSSRVFSEIMSMLTSKVS